MARKKKEEAPPPGAPAWMATFSDLITLVLTFFVLLYSFSSLDVEKFKSTAEMLSGQPSVFYDQAAIVESLVEVTNPTMLYEERENSVEETTEWEEIYGDLEEAVMAGNLGANVNISQTEGEINIILEGDVMFESGSDVLRPEILPIFDAILEQIAVHADLGFVITTVRVEGHTDNVPISTARFPDNQYLSMRRAYSADTYIREIQPQLAPLLLTGGYGETRPIADNSTSEGRAKNRRVELVIMRDPQDIERPLTAGEAEEIRQLTINN